MEENNNWTNPRIQETHQGPIITATKNNKTYLIGKINPEKPEELINPEQIPTELKQGIIQNTFGKETTDPNKIKPNLILLMNNIGQITPIQGIQGKIFTINTPEGPKSINLHVNKRYMLKQKGGLIPTYVIHEDIATPLPEDPLHTSGQLKELIAQMSLTKNLKEMTQIKAIKLE